MEETKHIKYTKGYKYMLEENAYFYTGIPEAFITKRVVHYANGWMMIREGFASDGASGLTVDTKTNMRSALVHDALYYLMRKGFPLIYRKVADQLLHDYMVEDGAFKFRASYYKWAVAHFGRNSALPKNQRKVLIAP